MYIKYLNRLKQGCRRKYLPGIGVKSFSHQDVSSFDKINQNSQNSCCTFVQKNQDNSPESTDVRFLTKQFQNWLQVVLALRFASEYVAPVINQAVKEMHHQLLFKYGSKCIPYQQLKLLRTSGKVPPSLNNWIKDVKSNHRSSISTGSLVRFTDVTKWPTEDGSWEIARVFMSQGYRSGTGNTSSSFDTSALFSYMFRCRNFERYLQDINVAKNILEMRDRLAKTDYTKTTIKFIGEENAMLSRCVSANQSQLISLRNLYDNITRDFVNVSKQALTLNKACDQFQQKIENQLDHLDSKVTSLHKQVDEFEECMNRSEKKPPSTSCKGTWQRILRKLTRKKSADKPTPSSRCQTKCQSENVLMGTGTKRKKDENYNVKMKKRKNDLDPVQANLVETMLASLKDSDVKKKNGGGGGGSNTKYQNILQTFLLSQNGNKGASYYETMDENSRYHSKVTFVSNFAVSTPEPQPTEQDAEATAAKEALKNLGLELPETISDPVQLFKDYCEEIHQETLSFHTFVASHRCFVTLIQFFNNYSIARTDVKQDELFIELKYSSLLCDTVSITESMAANSVLAEANIFTTPQNAKQQLNEYCLQRGGTLPLYYTNQTENNRTGQKILSSTVRSYLRNSLTDSRMPNYCNGPDDIPDPQDKYIVYADIVETESFPQRSMLASSETAAKQMLDKLGVVSDGKTHTPYMERLEAYAREWGYTVVPHTREINLNVEVPTMYDCVVTSKCLKDTKQSFIVCSNVIGTYDSNDAKESAALNALRLLGVTHNT
uniref:uncharacterized protein LOC100184222 isoform X2 n=1 Tax=Ciona intestinalis TaxID=7719 RepID=UPI000EF504F1|nr:uncharacterized protein LOC100184222 isoform X2 [Ciona intestinalis]|eukprot:XP_026690976.1 uncharacterized protein LOC100184222 isoform X2 [Ciona intestinalis]